MYTVHIMNNNQKEDATTLEILQSIENKKDFTQRHLANRLGVALGLANSYLKRCVRKGLVKIHQAPANRYLYYLTPKGLSEKSRLTTEYLTHSFDFYRQAGNSIDKIFEDCCERDFKNLLLCGISELAEIALIRSHAHEITLVGIWEKESEVEKFLGLDVWLELNETDKFDACVITSLENASHYFHLARESFDHDKIMTPSILDISLDNSNI